MKVRLVDGSTAAVRYERVGDVAVLRLNRPERLNAVNDALLNELCDALARAAKEVPGAVVLTGEGRSFCAGHDLKQPAETEVDPGVVARLERLAEVTRRIRHLPLPVISAVSGYALGAGCEFAICCDLVVAAPDAVFGFPEVEVGLAVTGGVTRLLPLAVGAAKANELVLLGTRLSGREAAALGLVNALADDPLGHAMNWAEELASKPRLALAMAKSCLVAGLTGGVEAAFTLETAASIALLNTPDALAAAATFQARHQDGARPASP